MPAGGGLAKATMALANRWVTTRQLGFLLGFMGTRVLGQYDLALLSAEADARPAAVRRGEHPRARPARWASRSAPFRTWIALHETTHAFEFEAHPWLRPYLADAARAPADACSAATRAGSAARRCAGSAGRSAARRGGEHWMERLMGDEQKRLFRETQAVMSLLEGFSDYVMDEVGRGPRARRRADQRALPRAARRGARRSSASMLRLTGMDLKLEQYREGRARSSGPSPRRAAGRADPAVGRARRRCRATARSRHPSAGSRGSSTAAGA